MTLKNQPWNDEEGNHWNVLVRRDWAVIELKSILHWNPAFLYDILFRMSQPFDVIIEEEDSLYETRRTKMHEYIGIINDFLEGNGHSIVIEDADETYSIDYVMFDDGDGKVTFYEEDDSWELRKLNVMNIQSCMIQVGDSKESFPWYKNIFTYIKAGLSKELSGHMTSLWVEVTDEGRLIIPNQDSINLVERWVSEIYIWWQDGQIIIFIKTNNWKWYSYNIRKDWMNYSYEIGLSEEDALAQMQRLGIWPSLSRIAINTLPAALLTDLTCPTVEDLETALRRLKDIPK